MDGSNWGNADTGTDLQTIIDNAMSADTIWIGCETYTPTTGLDRSIYIRYIQLQKAKELGDSFELNISEIVYGESPGSTRY